MAFLDREGTFEARVTDADVETTASGAVMAKFTFAITREWDKAAKDYGPDWPEGYETTGNVCFAKKNGEVMGDNVKRIAETMGWNGKVANIGGVIGALVRIQVKREEYNGNTYFRADRIESPNSGSSVAKIDEMFGAQFEAYAAEVGPVAPARAAAPAAPAAPFAPPVPPAPPAAVAPEDDDIAF